MKYLKLVRFQNLAIIALVQCLVRFGLFEPFGIAITLNHFGFFLLVLATICIAAGGNIINDLFDVEIDRINMPKKVLIGKKITAKTANILYLIFTGLGVLIGFYLSNIIGRPGFAVIFIGIAALLYLYASYLKSYLLVGNILISFLVGFSILIVGLYDLLPAITPQNRAIQATIFSILFDYSVFAFFINLIREIVKDLQDINGDKNGGKNSLAIALGRKRTSKIVFVAVIALIGAIVWYIYEYLFTKQWLVLYFLFLIVAPLIYFLIKIYSAEKTDDFAFLSLWLKVIMVTGIASLALYQFTIL